MRTLPDALKAVIARARALERDADTYDHKLAAIRGTSALLLAARDAGWSAKELSAGTGMALSTVNARILHERRRREGNALGLEVPAPPVAGLIPAKVRRLPVEQRDWLTSREACELAGVCSETLGLWRGAGLLPNTWRTARTHFLYARGDLERIMRAPRRGRVGVDRRTLAEQIRRSD